MNLFVSLFRCLVVHSRRKCGNRQTHSREPSTVTLAAHAHRGLMRVSVNTNEVQRQKIGVKIHNSVIFTKAPVKTHTFQFDSGQILSLPPLFSTTCIGITWSIVTGTLRNVSFKWCTVN